MNNRNNNFSYVRKLKNWCNELLNGAFSFTKKLFQARSISSSYYWVEVFKPLTKSFGPYKAIILALFILLSIAIIDMMSAMRSYSNHRYSKEEKQIIKKLLIWYIPVWFLLGALLEKDNLVEKKSQQKLKD